MNHSNHVLNIRWIAFAITGALTLFAFGYFVPLSLFTFIPLYGVLALISVLAFRKATCDYRGIETAILRFPVLRVLILSWAIIAIGTMSVFVQRNLSPYAAVLVGIAGLHYVFFRNSRWFILAGVIYCAINFSPVDVDLKSRGGSLRVIPIRMGLIDKNTLREDVWLGGCVVNFYEPLWMVTARAPRTAP